MKSLDIAIKDITRSFRSAIILVFMFVVPLGMSGLFYFMFGNIAQQGGFNLPQVQVVVANLDQGGPKFQTNTKSIPGSIHAKTMGELVVGVLQSKDMSDLLKVSLVPDAASAHAAVDNQQAQVAIIIPADFSRQFADMNAKASIEFYQDPTLTIGPGVVQSILDRFMDGMSGVKIALDVAMDESESEDLALVGQVVQEYLDNPLLQDKDPAAELIDVRQPGGSLSENAQQQSSNERGALASIVGPIMGGMMIFYAFYTGAATAQSILKEEEERTLPRLFTTPTPQVTILTGKFLAVFLTVLVQVTVLLIVSRFLFGIDWGSLSALVPAAAGIVFTASSFGIFINSLMKDTKQGGVVFGGVLTLSGMIGIIGIITMGSPSSAALGNSVSLLVPQGWAVHGLVQAMGGKPEREVLLTLAALLAWGIVFFITGVWRFNRRYT